MSRDSVDDRLKYQYVSRKNYDYHQDRAAKKFDGILTRLAQLENFIHDLHSELEVVSAEVEGIRLDKTSVRIAGRRGAFNQHD